MDFFCCHFHCCNRCWEDQKKDPHIPEVVPVPKNQQGTDTSSLWRYELVNRQHIIREEDQPQTDVFNSGCEFINNNWKENNWMLQIETFDPRQPFQVMDHYLNMYSEEDYPGKHYNWPQGKIESETSEEIEQVRKSYQ